MGASSSSSSYMTSEQAGRAASYIDSMNSVMRLNADAEEFKYQATILRNNKDIYETKLGLSLSELQADVDNSRKSLIYQSLGAGLKAQTDVALKEGQIEALKGAQAERELAGAQQLQSTATSYNQNVKEQLYNIRKDATQKISETYGSFVNRGFGVNSTNARTMIYNDLDDREYRSRLQSDYALLAINQGQANYNATTALQRQNLQTDIQNVETSISGVQQDLQIQLGLYRTQLESINNKANIQKQQLVYDSLVKTYQDESQARLMDYRSGTSSKLATNTLLSAQLRLAASADKNGFVRVEGY